MSQMPEKVTFEISLHTIFKVIAVGVLLWLVFLTKGALALVFVALVLASALDPWVDRLQRLHLPRWLAVLLIYIIGLGVVALVVSQLIPPIVDQFTQLGRALPEVFDRVTSDVENVRTLAQQFGVLDNVKDSLTGFASNIDNVASSLVVWLSSLFGGVISFIAVLSLVFYITVEESALRRFVCSVLPAKYQPYAVRVINRIQIKLGYWIRGQLVLGVVIGVISYIGLRIVGVPYALVLALISGIFELVPYVGPFISAVPAVLLALVISPYKALFILLWYVGMQTFENQVLVPNVMKHAVGLNPIIVLVAILVGAKLGGIIGMILAVPTATIVAIIASDFIEKREEKESQLESE